MRQIFGRKLIARNQEVAAHFANLADMDAITMDGDEINRKGSIQVFAFPASLFLILVPIFLFNCLKNY